MNIAIIPARAGSKRIKNKNTKNFLEIPIIQRILNTIDKSRIYKHCIIFTDCEKVKKIVEEFNIYLKNIDFFIVDEPKNIASDNISTYEAIRYLYDNYIAKNSQMFNNDLEQQVLTIIYPTAVGVEEQDLIKCNEIIKNEKYNSIFCCEEVEIFRTFKKENEIFSMRYPEFEFTRSQEIEKSYKDLGQFYMVKSNDFLEQKKIYLDKLYGYVMNSDFVQDINTEYDWKLAELKYKLRWGI